MVLEKTQALGSEAVAAHPWSKVFDEVKASQAGSGVDSVTIGEANGDRILKELELVMKADASSDNRLRFGGPVLLLGQGTATESLTTKGKPREPNQEIVYHFFAERRTSNSELRELAEIDFNVSQSFVKKKTFYIFEVEHYGNIRWTREEVVNRQTRAKADQVNYG